MITFRTLVIFLVLATFGIVDGSLTSLLFSCSDCVSLGQVLTDLTPKLSSLLCADARFPYSGPTARGENSATKSVRTCPLIVAFGKNLMSDWPSLIAYLMSRLDRSACDKMFFNRNSMYTTMGCA